MELLPEPLEQRISRVRPKRVIRVLLDPEQESISFTAHLIDPKSGRSLNQDPESSWTLSGDPIFQEGEKSLDWSEQGNDWFDLRLAWSNSELQLTPEELRALLDAQDKAIVIASQGHRLFRIRRQERLFSALNELGIAPQDLAGAPQRLHLLHLNRVLDPELVTRIPGRG
jgi:hypothetical protein